MFFEYISKILGLLKLCIYKLFYPTRIKISGIPQVNKSIRILTKKGAKIVIGRGFKCRYGVLLRADEGSTIILGDNVFLNDRVSINSRKKISIGNNTIIGPGVMFFDHDHDYEKDMNNFVIKDITVKDDCWIGANSLILKGAKVESNVVIAAGCIVTKTIQQNSILLQPRTNLEKEIKR